MKTLSNESTEETIEGLLTLINHGQQSVYLDLAIAKLRELLALRKEREAAVPVRYMNRYTGACYTLEQQPDAATDTMVYVPLYDEAQPVLVPDGYALVPVDPTPEMMAEICLVEGWTERALKARYQAMLAAAPGKEG